MTDTILEAQNVHKRFGGTQALRDFNLQVQRGEVHALLGENGAGKSTFVKILSGDVIPETGTVYFDGQELTRLNTQLASYNPHRARNLGISMVYQELRLVPGLTVAENILLGNYQRRSRGFPAIDWRWTERRAQQLVEHFGLDIDVTKTVRDLSVGSRQLVEVIRAVSLNVKLLLLDEPTSALSPEEIQVLFDNVIRRMREHGNSVIYISHRLPEVFEIADRVTVMRDGERISTSRVKDTNEDELIKHMVGREIKQRYVKTPQTLGEEVLRAEGIRVPGRVVDGRLNVRRGEIVGLGGLMGAGRTELAKGIIGLYPKSAGTVQMFGREVDTSTPGQALHAGIAYLSENRSEGLVLPLDIGGNITLAALDRVCTAAKVLRRDKETEVAEELIRQLDIDTRGVQQQVRELSGGNQQKVALARWIFTNVDVFILDEPTRGIDVAAKVQVYRIMTKLLKNGKAIVMISSELPEVVSLSDRVFVMHRGYTVAEHQGDQITQERIMASATGKGEKNGRYAEVTE